MLGSFLLHQFLYCFHTHLIYLFHDEEDVDSKFLHADCVFCHHSEFFDSFQMFGISVERGVYLDIEM